MNNVEIEAKNIKKNFGNIAAVNDISFQVNKNEIFGLLGPNGSGKTTVQRILTTVLEPTGGEITISGKTIMSENDKEWIRGKLGYVPQGSCLYKDLTVGENLKIFSAPYELSAEKRFKNIEKTMKRLDIYEQKECLVKNLSGGLARRVSIAAALVHEPDIIFFDEVTMGLDPISRNHIWQLTKQLKKEATIILTTHYMEEAEALCDQIAVLSEGKIVENGSPSDIIQHHQAKNLDAAVCEIIKGNG